MTGRPLDSVEQLCGILGQAVVRLWSDLPQDVQQRLFEEALTTDGERLRPQLAQFLHDRHTRTLAGAVARALIEPDSLGG